MTLVRYLRLYISRKFRRLLIFVFVFTIISVLMSLMIILDITCIPHPYNPSITLKKSFEIKPKTEISYPKWTPIVDNIISIYSAFVYEKKIIIIGVIDQKFKTNKFYCHFRQNGVNRKSDGLVYILPESWADFYRFVSIKIICEKSGSIDSLKTKVSFEMNDQNLETSYVTINQISSESNGKEKPIVVCVRPLFGPFTSSAEILEFIAYYSANGIQRIIFYDLSIAEDIKQVLVNIPFVQLLSYDLPIDSSDIHADGQIAALNDCVLRSSDGIVIHVDIDELIVTSNKFANIKDFVDHKSKDPLIGALIIPNVMLCDEFNGGNNFPRILNATVRQTFKWEHRDRSKAIILKPLSVDRLGIHTVWSWTDRKIVSYNVKEKDAMLFHYRSCCRVWQPFYHNKYLRLTLFFLAYEDKVVPDLRVKRFETQIIQFLKQFIEFSIN